MQQMKGFLLGLSAAAALAYGGYRGVQGITPVMLTAGGIAVNSTNPLPTTMGGSALTAVPTNWITGTNWNGSSSPALPSNIKAVWVDVAPGTTCTIQVDGGGATAFQFPVVQTGWFFVPAGLNITNIYAPANGSTGAVIAGVVS